MAFTEFYCDPSNGSNLNAGSTTASAAAFTYASGNWVASTGVFTVASGNPSSDGVAVGDFASVYANGSTTTGFVGRVTARDATTITVSLTAKIGTAPTDGTGTRTLKIAGAWKGPNAADGFPLTLIANTLTNAAGDYPRVNLKNNATYNVTATIGVTGSGPYFVQGYSSTVNDGGRATIDGGTSGTSYNLLYFNTANTFCTRWQDLIFQNNGATGGAKGILLNTSSTRFNTWYRCKFSGFRGAAVQFNGANAIIECEVVGSVKNGSDYHVYCSHSNAESSLILRCYIHDPAGASARGIGLGSINTTKVISSIIANHTSHGVEVGANNQSGIHCINCDIYNNTGQGIDIQTGTNTADIYIVNCNFIKNGGYGVRGSGIAGWSGYLINCAFGAGTQANTSGTTNNLKGIVESGSITYAADVTPWVDPANGNFTINLAAAKNAGRGAFGTGLTSTVGYPDIGAAQHQDASSTAACPVGGFVL